MYQLWIYQPVQQLSGFTALARRGDCDYLIKAEVAQAAGAAALVVINDSEGRIFMQLAFFIFMTALVFARMMTSI